MASPFKKLSPRNWTRIRDHWLGHLPPIDFDAAYPHPTLWELPDFEQTLGATKKEEIIGYIPGVREAILREAVILARKLAYCWSIAQMSAGSGRQTWTAIAAYEASFYGAKSFCYMLGFASLGRDSRFYLDAFHESTVKIKKQNVTRLDLKIHDLHSRLEHSTLWAINERLFNTTTFAANFAQTHQALRAIDWSSFSAFRNRVMYVGSFWPFSGEQGSYDLTREFCHPEILAALDPLQSVVAPFAAHYFAVGKLFRSILHLMFADIAALAPAYSSEAMALQA
jgi:hypothetical protein